MSVIDTLITDRTQAHVDRLKALMRIGWQNMTDEEKVEYLGGNEQLYDANNQPLFDSQNEPLYSTDSGIQRGAYNCTDLNRVEAAVAYIAAELVQADEDLHDYAENLDIAWDSLFNVPYNPQDYEDIVIKTDWKEPEDNEPPWADPVEIARYYSNLELIASAFPVSTSIPDSMSGLDYNGANAIEQMLIEEHEALAVEVERIKLLIRGTLGIFYAGELYSGEMGDT